MTFVCELCDYVTDNKYYFLKHNKTKKHFDKIINLEIYKKETDNKKNKEETYNKKNKEETDKYVCQYCDIKIKHQSSYSRHTKKCKDNIEKDKNNYLIKLELEKIKLELEIKDKSELEKLKLELEIKDLKLKNQDIQHKLEIKDLEIKHLKDNKVKTINITNNNTINNISKLDNLNINYSSVIDIDTFMKNYETEIYGLSDKDADNLLYICKNGTVDNIINSFMWYMKDSMRKQCEQNNIILPNDKVNLPFIQGDNSMRYYFEKKNEKEWCKTTSTNNIENLVSITEKQVYDKKKESIYLGNKKRRVINGMIKKSTID
jgi:hypothetical protein